MIIDFDLTRIVLNDVIEHYKHPLGFYYFLLKKDDQESIRLHIWSDEVNERAPIDPNFPIHDHIWEFESYILAGELENIIYHESKDYVGKKFKIYKVAYRDEQSVLIHDGLYVQNLTQFSKVKYKAGDTYRMSAYEIHETIVSKKFTATILVTKNAGTLSPRVFGDENSLDKYCVSRKIVNAKLANHLLNILKSYISKF